MQKTVMLEKKKQLTKKVMVVDDEEVTVELVKTILEKEGFQVLTASNGKECLQKMQKQVPDLVLLDIMMPEMSGWKTLFEMRQKKEWNKVKVVFLSVKGVEEYKAHDAYFKELYSSYIQKPFSPKELVQKVKKIFAG